MEAVIAALKAGRKLAYIRCTHCSAAHLDEGEWATKLHRRHTCNTCGKMFLQEGAEV